RHTRSKRDWSSDVCSSDLHAWLDGRDTPPQSALAFMRELGDLLAQQGGRAVVSTVVGRYYAMDRDKRWDRTKIAYDAMVHGVGEIGRASCRERGWMAVGRA